MQEMFKWIGLRNQTIEIYKNFSNNPFIKLSIYEHSFCVIKDITYTFYVSFPIGCNVSLRVRRRMSQTC